MNKDKIVFAFIKNYTADIFGNIFNKKGIKIKGSIDNNGYKVFGVCINKRPTKIPFHRYIAYLKFEDKLFDADCVRHLDGNKLNNSWDNLQIGSHQENMLDVDKQIRIEKSSKARLIHNHLEIINFYNECKSYKKTMTEFNLSSKGTLHFILKNSLQCF